MRCTIQSFSRSFGPSRISHLVRTETGELAAGSIYRDSGDDVSIQELMRALEVSLEHSGEVKLTRSDCPAIWQTDHSEISGLLLNTTLRILAEDAVTYPRILDLESTLQHIAGSAHRNSSRLFSSAKEPIESN